ncbi:hypothetical protein P3L51_25625 [Streptomyces sp. PSRA5]|uniref:hypothetical protein n=1 Tax=Streptomyces panacea TaxID=3035064 RepID=UPI00339C8E26
MIGGRAGTLSQLRGGKGALAVPGRDDPQREGPYAVSRRAGGGGMGGAVALGLHSSRTGE